MWRIIKFVSLIFLLFIIIISLSGIILAWYYQDEVKQLMISQINKHIKTEIYVSEVSFSVLRKFPQASVKFRDVLIKVPEEFDANKIQGIESDTLFTAQNLFVQFNIRDLFRKEYKITNIHAVKGVLYLAVNSVGQENFRFWKLPDSPDEKFNLDFQDLRLNNYHLKFNNNIKDIYLDMDLRRLEMKGNFSHSFYRLKGMASGVNREFRRDGLMIAGNQDLSVKVAMVVNNDLFSIEQGSIDLAGLKLEVSGDYIKGEPGSVNLDLKGQNLDISSVIPLLPVNIRNEFQFYIFNGKFNFESSFSGDYSKSQSPSVFASFYSEAGEIIRKDTGMRLTGMELSGHYSNGNLQSPVSSTVVIDKFYSSFGIGSISGNGSFSNFSSPSIVFDVNASFLLEELGEFYKPRNIVNMAGKINTAISVKGNLQATVKLGIEEFNKFNLRGLLEIENGMLEISESKYIASEIDGKINFENTIITPGLSFNIGRDHFSLRGEIDNGLPWLLGHNQTMMIYGSLYSRKINLDNYIYNASATQLSNYTQDPLLFPSNLELNLDFLVDDINFKNFTATGFRGKLSYKPRMVVLNTTEFDAMDGKVSGNGVIVQNINDDLIIQTQLQLQDVNIQKMFLSFNDFGQTFIQAENLKGSINGNVSLISGWTPYLKLINENIIADSKFEIRNGELIDFEPLLGLSRFISINELQHIRFSNLKNEIFIRDQVLTIPLMDINSSAFNISGSGMHHFNGHFDYRLRVLLSDILYGKASRAKPENQQFGIVEDDGLGRTSLYLLVSGKSDDYRVSYDTRAVRDVIRGNLANERNVLRRLLNEEFGWFAADSLSVTGSGKSGSSENRFRITWDEEDETNSPVTKPAPPRW